MKFNDIAVVGMACRFPGANHPDEFWENILRGEISITTIPAQRWNYKDYYGDLSLNSGNVTNSMKGGFIQDIDKFDASFFNVSNLEAKTMDPQQRIMLELSVHCFEDACIPPEKILDRRVGVYVSIFNLDYKELQEQPG